MEVVEVVSLPTRCTWLLALAGSCTDVENDGWDERLEGSVQELRRAGGSRVDAGARERARCTIGIAQMVDRDVQRGGAVWVNEGNDCDERQLKHIIRVCWRCVMVMCDGDG
jgi:hypothetical protein